MEEKTLFREIVESVFRDIKKEEIIKESLKRIVVENSGENMYEIKNFTPDMPEWNSYIKPNKNQIFEFLDNGYRTAGLKNGFLGCDGPKQIVRNSKLIRIAFCNDVWVAMSVYTSYMGGFKCVGITATSDRDFREIGVNAVHEIVKTDVGLYDEFYWTECSGAVERLYDKYGGIKIPSEFFGQFIRGDYEIVDEYHFEREFDNDVIKKAIFGFNTPETFNMVYEKCKSYIDRSIEKIKSNNLNESGNSRKTGYLHMPEYIVDLFIELKMQNRMYDFPEASLKVLQENIVKLEKQIESGLFNGEILGRKREVLRMGKDVLGVSQPMVLHKF